MKVYVLKLLYTFFATFAAFVGVVLWRKLKDPLSKAFVVYLVIIASLEWVSRYLKHVDQKEWINQLAFFVMIPLQFLFAFWFIYKSTPLKRLKGLGILFACIGVGSMLTEILYFDKLDEKYYFHSFSYIVFVLLLTIMILIYFFQFTKTHSRQNYLTYFGFWVCTGYMIYYIGTFPLFAFYNLLYNWDYDFFLTCWQVQMYLNSTMYLLFSIGLIWTRKELK